jgi:hypothetical protein
MRIGYWWESHKERDHREDQGVGGWTILELNLENLISFILIRHTNNIMKTTQFRPVSHWTELCCLLNDLRRIGWYGMDWIDLAQDRDQWRALVNRIMNLRVP